MSTPHVVFVIGDAIGGGASPEVFTGLAGVITVCIALVLIAIVSAR